MACRQLRTIHWSACPRKSLFSGPAIIGPNRTSGPSPNRAATEQLIAALEKLGRSPYVVEGYLTRPDQAITKLGPIDDPLIGVFVHWTYATHTVDGVAGKNNPLLLASNFSGTWPGLVALLNTAASLESVGRPAARIWTDAADWTADADFMERLDEWCTTGDIRYSEVELNGAAPIAPEATALARQVEDGIRNRRVLALMLGDTSMGMINGYFGPRLLYPIGFSEHKVDQAWLIERTQAVDARGWTMRFDSSRTAASSSTGKKPMPPTSHPRPRASS